CCLEALWNVSPLDWTTLAYTQGPDNLAILHLGPLSGPLTVSAILVAVNGLVAEAILSGRWRRWGGAAIALCLGAHLLGVGLYRQPLQDRADQAIQVGLIQGNIPTREKLFADGIRQARDVYLAGYQDLAAMGVDAILTPEGAIPVLFDRAQPDRDLFYRWVYQQPTGAPILWLGQFLLEPLDRDSITQSLISIAPQRGIVGQYNKIKLVPLGEYIPLQSVFRGLISRLSPIGTDMIPGHPQQQFETGLGRAAGGICFDSVFSWLFRDQVAQGGTFMLTASNIDPYPRRTMMQLHSHEVMRAIETSRWGARATNTGLSGVIDAHGRTIWLSTAQQSAVHAETLYRRDYKTLYVRWGNWLTPVLLGLSLLRLGQKRILNL
ncbi:MAG: apolipoprotein N-acyltransferase, partial [Cyanobacteria bacterium P01_A01_bin.105]